MLRLVLALGLALAPPDDARVFEIVPAPAPGEAAPGEAAASEAVPSDAVPSEPPTPELPNPAVPGVAPPNPAVPGVAPPNPAVPGVAPPNPVPPPPSAIEVDPVNYRIVLAGDVLVGFGGVGFVIMCAGLVVRNDASIQRLAQAVASEPDLDAIARQDRRIVLGTGLAIAGGVSAALLFASGIGTIIGGRQRERRRRAALHVGPTPRGLALRF